PRAWRDPPRTGWSREPWPLVVSVPCPIATGRPASHRAHRVSTRLARPAEGIFLQGGRLLDAKGGRHQRRLRIVPDETELEPDAPSVQAFRNREVEEVIEPCAGRELHPVVEVDAFGRIGIEEHAQAHAVLFV